MLLQEKLDAVSAADGGACKGGARAEVGRSELRGPPARRSTYAVESRDRLQRVEYPGHEFRYGRVDEH